MLFFRGETFWDLLGLKWLFFERQLLKGPEVNVPTYGLNDEDEKWEKLVGQNQRIKRN